MVCPGQLVAARGVAHCSSLGMDLMKVSRRLWSSDGLPRSQDHLVTHVILVRLFHERVDVIPTACGQCAQRVREAIASELKQLALMRLEQSEAELEDDLSWVRGEGTLSAAGEQEPSGVARGGVLRGVRRAGWRP